MHWDIHLDNHKFKLFVSPNIPQMVYLPIEIGEKKYKVLWNPILRAFFITDSTEKNQQLSKIIFPKNIQTTYDSHLSQTTVSFTSNISSVHEATIKPGFLGYLKSGSQTKQQALEVESPITGRVIKVLANSGSIHKDDTVLIIDSMKMENKISSPSSGTIDKICVKEGQTIKTGQTLFILKK